MKLLIKMYEKFLYSAQRHASNLPFVHVGESAVFLNNARFRFDAGVKNFEGAVRVGKDSMVNCEFIFESNNGNITIGDRTFINSGTKLICRSSISIGSDVTIAWGCTIYDHNSHSVSPQHRADDIALQNSNYKKGLPLIAGKNWASVKSKKIEIQDKAWIGFNCTILSGVVIGAGAVVGAGSVVRSNVDAWTIVAGNPAVMIRRIEQ